jgi:hypothetical protein
LTWVVMRNPMYTGAPRLMKPACHDRTPMVDVICGFCGATNHIHEGQIDGAPRDAELWMNCASCRKPSVMEISMMFETFEQMREEGWYE